MGRQGELLLRHVDKNGQHRGGPREGAGRPRKGHRSSERHEVRPALVAREPLHVITRVVPRAHGLRRRDTYAAIRDASFIAAAHAPDFRIVHLSIQRTHLHLIVEAKHRTALWKGMQGFLISAARGINRALGKRGPVFADRYHARALRMDPPFQNSPTLLRQNSPTCLFSDDHD
jgi:REP element-mobilizing transposase RayT